MRHDEGWVTNTDGIRLYWQRRAPEGEPAAVLLFVHGLAEHSGRYLHVMEHFAERGFDCWALDYRGHGKSPGLRGPAGNPRYPPLRAPWVRILGATSTAMSFHLRDAATTKTDPCRRNPPGRWGLRPISSLLGVEDARASTSSSRLDIGSQDPSAAGIGGSSRVSGVHVYRFDEFLTDLRAAHRLVRNACPGWPLILIGHSQGGLITLRYTLAHPEDLTAIVVSSPFLGLHPDARPNAVLRLVAHLLSVVTPRLMLSKPPDASLLSRDPRVGEAYLADPLVSRSVSARWFTEVMAAHRDTLERAGELRVRTLVMQSGADRLADPAATRAWVGAAPADLVDYVEWEGFYHEMFNEPEQERVFDRVEEWLSSF